MSDTGIAVLEPLALPSTIVEGAAVTAFQAEFVFSRSVCFRRYSSLIKELTASLRLNIS